MSAVRLTVALDRDLVRRVKAASGGNVSRFIGRVLEEELEARRREQLRRDLIAGCREDAELDLELVREWETLDRESLPESEGTGHGG